MDHVENPQGEVETRWSPDQELNQEPVLCPARDVLRRAVPLRDRDTHTCLPPTGELDWGVQRKRKAVDC